VRAWFIRNLPLTKGRIEATSFLTIAEDTLPIGDLRGRRRRVVASLVGLGLAMAMSWMVWEMFAVEAGYHGPCHVSVPNGRLAEVAKHVALALMMAEVMVLAAESRFCLSMESTSLGRALAA